jgi:hypothetical protein
MINQLSLRFFKDFVIKEKYTTRHDLSEADESTKN